MRIVVGLKYKICIVYSYIMVVEGLFYKGQVLPIAPTGYRGVSMSSLPCNVACRDTSVEVVLLEYKIVIYKPRGRRLFSVRYRTCQLDHTLLLAALRSPFSPPLEP